MGVFLVGDSSDALIASVRGQDADRIEDPDRSVRKRKHLVPGFKDNSVKIEKKSDITE